jgi:hypothetical protein
LSQRRKSDQRRERVGLLPSNSLQIPCNREFYREFCRLRPFFAIFGQNIPAIPVSCSEIPYAGEQGIFSGLTGNFWLVTGNNREFAKAAVIARRPGQFDRNLLQEARSVAAALPVQYCQLLLDYR